MARYEGGCRNTASDRRWTSYRVAAASAPAVNHRKGVRVRTFLHTFSAGLIAATLLSSGVGHVTRFRTFCTDLRSHRVLPRRLVWSAATIVTVTELLIGSAAAQHLLGSRAEPFIGGLVLGLMF